VEAKNLKIVQSLSKEITHKLNLDIKNILNLS